MGAHRRGHRGDRSVGILLAAEETTSAEARLPELLGPDAGSTAAIRPLPRRQANVLQHMLGYFKQTLDRESRAELLGLIEDHAIGRVPLVVPLTLFGHHIRRCGVPYLADQVYLRPHPVELMLRNHV